MPDLECRTVNSSRRIQNFFSVMFFSQDFSILTKTTNLRTWGNFAQTDSKLAAKFHQLKVKKLLEKIIGRFRLSFFFDQ